MARFTQKLGFSRYEADEYYRRALDAYKKGDFDSAVDAITDAINLLPDKSEYYAARGFFQVEDGAHAEALADFDQALRLYPYEMLAHYGRGMIAYKNKDWDAALAHFTMAQRIDPQRPETLYYLALAHYHRGDLASAINTMGQAQAAFERANDKRKADVARWLREFQRMIEKPVAAIPPPKHE